MRGLAVAGIVGLVVALLPVASADPLLDDLDVCVIDVTDPVIRACLFSWDEPQVTCTDIQIGVRVVDECFDDPDFPPRIPPDPPHIPTPLLATPNVLCVPETSGSDARVCLYTFGGPDEGCVEARALGEFRGTCWTLPFPTLP